MTSTPPSPGSRPVALWLAFGAVAAGLALVQLHPRYAGDLWWHLWGGAQVLEHGWFSFPDHATFTQDGWRWASTEWIFQLLLLASWRGFGAHGLTALVAGAAGLTGALLGALAWRVAPQRPWLAVLGAALVAGAVSGHFLARPQILFLPALALLLLLLERRLDRRGVILLLLLHLLWTHSHGSHVIAPAVVACRTMDRWREGWRALRPGALLVGAMGAISALLGPRGPAVILDVLHHAGTDSARHIGDMRPPAWEDLAPAGLEPGTWLLLLLALAVFASLSRRPQLGDLLLAGLGLAMTLTAVRFETAWAILLLPLALRGAPSVQGERARAERIGAMAVALLLLPGSWLWMAERDPVLRPGLGLWEPSYPVAATALLESQGAEGHLFNNISDGGYLIWHLAPKMQVAIDFRTPTFHTPEHHALWRQSNRSLATFEGMDARWGIDHALVKRSWPLCDRLAASSSWRAVHVDRYRVLFTRADSPLLPGFALEHLPLCAEAMGCPADGREAADRWREIEQLFQLEPQAHDPWIEGLRLLACSPDSVEPELALRVAQGALAGGFLDAGDLARAAELLAAAGLVREALDLTLQEPADLDLLLLRGALSLRLGEPVAAAEALLEAAELADDSMMLADRLLLARALAEAGEPGRAAHQALRVAASGDPGALDLLEELLPRLRADQADDARAWLEVFGTTP